MQFISIAKINIRSWLPWAFIWYGTFLAEFTKPLVIWLLSVRLPPNCLACTLVGGGGRRGAGVCVCVFAAQLCATLGNPMDCSPPRTSVHGILQARRLEQVAISFSRGSSQPRDWTPGSWIPGRILYHLSQHFRSTQTVPKCRALSHQRSHTSCGNHISCLLVSSLLPQAGLLILVLDSADIITVSITVEIHCDMTVPLLFCLHLPSWLLRAVNIFHVFSSMPSTVSRME